MRVGHGTLYQGMQSCKIEDSAFHVQFVSDVTQMPSSSVSVSSHSPIPYSHLMVGSEAMGDEWRIRLVPLSPSSCMSYNPLLSFCAAECHVPQLSISLEPTRDSFKGPYFSTWVGSVQSEVGHSDPLPTLILRKWWKTPLSEMGFASRTRRGGPAVRTDITTCCQISFERTWPQRWSLVCMEYLIRAPLRVLKARFEPLRTQAGMGFHRGSHVYFLRPSSERNADLKLPLSGYAFKGSK